MAENNYEAKTLFTLPTDIIDQPMEQSDVNNSVDNTQPVEATVTEGTNIDGYFVNMILSTQGNESWVYRVRKDGDDYVLKLYKYAFKVSESKMEGLKSVTCPYVAGLVDYGYYNGKLYEVYHYYENGSIDNCGPISTDKIKSYVNQLNQGLHALHSISDEGMMVHGDIKPSNIFLSNDKESVIIGDFGISTIIDGDSGYGIGSIAGTPEFAPPSMGVVDKMKKTTAYDYGSLGLVVYYMVTGYSKFAGMSTEAIAKEWVNGITLDEIVDTRMRMLLQGLLVTDENTRFGYSEVKEWYDGSFLTVAKAKKTLAERKTKSNAVLWFGIFDGESIEVSSLKELAMQMTKHWNQAKNKLRDENLYDFLDKLDETKALSAEIRGFVNENNEDAAVFKTIYTLYNDSNIYYKGVNYGVASSFMASVAEGMNDDIKELLLSDLFEFYVNKMEYPSDTLKEFKAVLNMKNCPDDFKSNLLSYLFSAEKSYKGIKSLDELRTKVCDMNLEQINEISNDIKFIAWLHYMGLKEQAMTMLSYRGD